LLSLFSPLLATLEAMLLPRRSWLLMTRRLAVRAAACSARQVWYTCWTPCCRVYRVCIQVHCDAEALESASLS